MFFQQLNLLNNYNAMGKFDLVFCRNVLIYFSPEIKTKILSQIHGVLNNDSYLFLGASESLSGLNQSFDMIRLNHVEFFILPVPYIKTIASII